MTFRSRKDVQTIKILGCCIKDGLMFKRSCGSEKLKGFEDWASYEGEIIIQKDRCGNFNNLKLSPNVSSTRKTRGLSPSTLYGLLTPPLTPEET